MVKPIIGVVPLVDIQRESYWMLPGYMDGIIDGGGVPVMLPLTDDRGLLERVMDICSGFVFTGGQDVCPEVYGQADTGLTGETCPERDAMERQLLRMALERGKPVLGICRGIQFINAALGGTLWQDIPSQCGTQVEHHQSPPYSSPSHIVRLLPGTPISELLGEGTIQVNSCHHQAVRILAPGLRPMAIAEDGIVEALWMPEHPFLWAVQWHPEFSWRVSEESRKIFSAFCGAACKR